MINPINISTNPIYYSKMPAKQTLGANTTDSSFELSDYKTGQAFLARNNISFRNLVAPIEVTDKYNKKIEGKDHLDLPNVHIYEYPDTNLQLFINEHPNMGKYSDIIQAKLYIKKFGSEEDLVKKEISIRLLSKLVNNKHEKTNVTKNYRGFFTLTTVLAKNEYKNLETFNKIINEPKFTQQDLDNVKKDLIEEIKSAEHKKSLKLYASLYGEDSLKSEGEIIDEINKISLEEIKNYYSNSIKNSEAQYFITADKTFLQNNKKEIQKSLNSNISRPYLAHTKEEPEKSPVFLPNLKDISIVDNDCESYAEMYYPCSSDTLKEYLTNLYLSFVCLFLRDPYIKQGSLPRIIETPLEAKSSANLATNILTFKFTPIDSIRNRKEEIVVQQGMLYDLYDKDFSDVLKAIKDYENELLEKEMNTEFNIKTSNNTLCDYAYDIFQAYEINESIKPNDIKHIIWYNIVCQQPIIIVNNKDRIQEDLKDADKSNYV